MDKRYKYDPAVPSWTLTVINTSGYELPSTGGSGTGWFYLPGALLAALGAAGLLFVYPIKNIKNKRTRHQNDF